MADETGVEDILAPLYTLIGAAMDSADRTLDVVGSQLRLGSLIPGLAVAAEVTRGISVGK
jgi:hypothetical protein